MVVLPFLNEHLYSDYCKAYKIDQMRNFKERLDQVERSQLYRYIYALLFSLCSYFVSSLVSILFAFLFLSQVLARASVHYTTSNDCTSQQVRQRFKCPPPYFCPHCHPAALIAVTASSLSLAPTAHSLFFVLLSVHSLSPLRLAGML